jgi:F-type H+-transporting ATPase subunit O
MNFFCLQYTAAVKSSSIEPVARSLTNLSAVFAKDAKLPAILSAPSLTNEDKAGIVAELLKHAGQPNDTVKNFLATLAENNRLGVLAGVCQKFGVLMSAHRGEVELVVTSAQPLDQRVLKQLESAVGKSKYVAQGQKLKVVPKVCAVWFVELGAKNRWDANGAN